jgi:MFS family permease
VPAERLYDRNFAFAFLSQIGFVFANTVLMAHYARWIYFLGGEIDAAGRITGTAFVAGLLLRPWIGQWIDRFGARAIWLTGYAIFAVGSLSNLWLHELGPAIYLCRTLLVVGAAFSFSCSLTYVAHLAPPHRRAEAIGTLGVAGFAGIIFGPFLGELMLSAERTRGEFEMMFLAAVGLLIVPAILLLMLRRPDSEARQSSLRLTEFLRTARRYWPGTIVLVQASFGLCMTVPFVFLTKYVDDAGLQDNGFSKVTLFYVCYAAWGLTLRVLLRRIPERLGRRKMCLAGTVVMSCGMLSFVLVDADHAGRIIIPALLCGSGHSLMYHTCTSLFLESFPSEVRGAGSALSWIAMDLGMIAGAQILGEVAFHVSYNLLFVIVGLTTFAAGSAYALASIPVWQQRWRAARDGSA